MTTEHLTDYPLPHHVTVAYRTIHPNGRPTVDGVETDDPGWQSVRTIVIDDKALCLPSDGLLQIEPIVGGAGHRITVEFWADSVQFEPNAEL